MTKFLKLIATQWLVPLFLLGIGLYFLHGPLLRDGANYIHGDLGDSRLIALLLEHSYRYLFRLDTELSFWSPSWIYFPARNGLAYSDVMTGAVFLYAPWRLLGVSQFSAYQIWFFLTSAANFASFMLLARYLRFSHLAAALGAYVVSFAMTNVAFANHPQMLSHYYVILTVYFLLRTFAEAEVGRRYRFAGLAAVTYALQYWTAFYPAWFMTFIGGLCAVYILGRKSRDLPTIVRTYLGPGLLFALLSGLLIYPLIRRYLIIKSQMGSRAWEEVALYLPTWQAYLFPTLESTFYKDLFYRFSSLFPYSSELCIFSGYVVLAAPLLYLIARRFAPDRSIQHIFVASIAFGLLATALLSLKWGAANDSFSLWKAVFKFVPGASAIRAMARISLQMNILSALLLAYAISCFQRRFAWGWVIGLGLAATVVTENAVEHNYLYSKRESLERVAQLAVAVRDAGHACEVFHRSYRPDGFPVREIDAMLLSQQLRIPTSNGYSGGMPPAYWNENIFRSQSIEKIGSWFNMNSHPIEQNKICFLP